MERVIDGRFAESEKVMSACTHACIFTSIHAAVATACSMSLGAWKFRNSPVGEVVELRCLLLLGSRSNPRTLTLGPRTLTLRGLKVRHACVRTRTMRGLKVRAKDIDLEGAQGHAGLKVFKGNPEDWNQESGQRV